MTGSEGRAHVREPADSPPTRGSAPTWRLQGETSGRGVIARFFVAVGVSMYADWLTTVALVVVLFHLTGNPAGPAGYLLVRVAPRVLGPWWGGKVADRRSPRQVMIVSATAQAAATAFLVVFVANHSIWGIYAAVAVAQFVGSVGRPSQGAMVPQLVSDRSLPRANAMYGLLFNTAIFVGPAFGAALLVKVGPNPLFVIDALSFVVCAALAATLPSGILPTKVHPAAPAAGINAFLRGALASPAVRMVAAANFVSGLVVTVTQALLIVAAHQRLGSDSAVGYLYSSVGLGGVLGGLIALRWSPARAWTRFAIFVAATIEAVTLAGFSAATLVPIAVVLLAVGAGSSTSFDVWALTDIQRRAPSGLMGRFNSIIFMSQYAGMLTGALWALGTASVLQWSAAVQIACAAGLALMAVTWLSAGRAAPPLPEQQGQSGAES